MKKTIIIMPVANEESTMANILDRILSLPYDKLFVYPVIDHYSKDNTKQIIEDYEHTGRVKCLFYEQSKGVVSCYLYGFKQALKDDAELAKQGIEYLVLEVTSHALVEYRTLGIPFEVAVFTNLTHEHLDYHKTIDRYRAAKGKLFKKAKFSILNADDPATKYYSTISQDYITYGIKHGQNRATDVKLGINGVKYSLGDIIIETNIPGEFNVYNSLAAALVGKHYGLTPQQISEGIKSLDNVEGRMNIIDEGQPFTVIVDYAHAPDALEKVFESIKNHKGRIISVHGGAGRRDPSTRPIRGRILAKYSDIVIITEDDSRDEDPASIAAAFIEGAKKQGKTLDEDLFLELDRRKAIKLALEKAKPGDVVLVLGKGHEKSILRADGPHEFNDTKVVRELLKKRA